MPGWKPDCFKTSSKGHCSGGDSEHKDLSQRTALPRNREIPDSRRGTTYVELRKKEGCGLGLTVSGGTDKGETPWVSNLRPGSIAARSDAIEIEDSLVAVNGIRTANLTHGEIINLLKNADDRVILELDYELPDHAPDNSYTIQCKTTKVTLDKDDYSCGFVVRGGICSDSSKSRPLTVGSIRPASAAYREGRLKSRDRILAINDINATTLTQFEAQNILDHLPREVTLLIEYDVSVMEAVENAMGPLLVEIDIGVGSGLGIKLASKSLHGKPVICIDGITPASIADRSGALHIGDQIKSIDDTSLEHLTVAEASSLLRQYSNDQIKLEIISVNQIKYSSNAVARANILPSPSLSYSTLNRYQSGTSATGTMRSMDRYGTMTSRLSGRQQDNSWPTRCRTLQSDLSIASSSLSVMLPGNQIYRSEVMQVTLLSSHRGFGLTLEGGVYPTDVLSTSPVISYIEPGSSAARGGILQEGDRILSINGQWLDDKTLNDAHQLFRESGNKCHLQVEFDIAETVVPSCGVFNVKLMKRGTHGLGITINTPQNRRLSDCLLITHVKKGSVAYRSGTIHSGDRLLAIDNIRLEHCSVEEAAGILQNSDEIVKLRIKRDGSLSEEPVKNTITYTVELEKHGGPLGVTISGTEEAYDPIIISELTEGGLALRTGALHVGDHILAINGQSLQSHPLSYAINMLQSAGDTVMLKVKKKVEKHSSKEDYSEKVSTPVTSVDSALGSWDDSGGEAVYSHHGHVQLPHAVPKAQCGQPKRGYPLSRSQQSQQYTRKYLDDIVNHDGILPDEQWENGSHCSYTSSIEAERDEWSRTLEDLRSCGQSEMLRQIEESLHIDEKPIYNSPEHLGIGPNNKISDEINGEMHNDKLEITEYYGDSNHRTDAEIILHPEPKEYSRLSHKSKHSKSKNTYQSDSYRSTEVRGKKSQNNPSIEVHKMNLVKYNSLEDFGFGLSDGLYDKGVYISAVRPDSSADKVGLQPFDRVLQVNNLKTRVCSCSETVPLIAESGNQVSLVVSRNPKAQHSSSCQVLADNETELDRSIKSCKTV